MNLFASFFSTFFFLLNLLTVFHMFTMLMLSRIANIHFFVEYTMCDTIWVLYTHSHTHLWMLCAFCLHASSADSHFTLQYYKCSCCRLALRARAHIYDNGFFCLKETEKPDRCSYAEKGCLNWWLKIAFGFVCASVRACVRMWVFGMSVSQMAYVNVILSNFSLLARLLTEYALLVARKQKNKSNATI